MRPSWGLVSDARRGADGVVARHGRPARLERRGVRAAARDDGGTAARRPRGGRRPPRRRRSRACSRRAEPAVATVCERALAELPRSEGVGRASAPRGASTITQLIMLPEATSAHLPWLRTRLADYGADVRARLLAGLLLPSTAYTTGLRARRWARAEYERALGRLRRARGPRHADHGAAAGRDPRGLSPAAHAVQLAGGAAGAARAQRALRLRRRPAGRAVADGPDGRGRDAAGGRQGVPAGDRLARAASRTGAGTRRGYVPG